MPKYRCIQLTKSRPMKSSQNYLFTLIFVAIFQTIAISQIQSDAFVSNTGELLANSAFTVKNNIDDTQELVKKMYYDADDRLVFQRNYDFEGVLMYDDNGIAIYEFDYDANNNIIEERYYDEEKNFFQRENIGAAVIKRKFSNEGKITEIAYFTENNIPLENGSAVIKYEYSNGGMHAIERHFNAKGMLVDFCAPIIALDFDTEGNIIRKVFMDNNEQACNRFMDEDENGVSMIEYEYDDLGNISLQRAFNKNGKLLGTIHS